jgi:hypothetical protein
MMHILICLAIALLDQLLAEVKHDLSPLFACMRRRHLFHDLSWIVIAMEEPVKFLERVTA